MLIEYACYVLKIGDAMVNIQVRVDEHLRDQAQQILSQIGMDMTTALTSSPP